MLVKSGDLRKAFSLFYSTPVKNQSQQVYGALFQARANQRNLHMSSYYTKYYSQDMFLSNHLITMYAKCGSIVYARKVFDEISERNVVSWTALITGYAQAWDEREGFCLFSDMLAHCCPNEFALSSVFDFVRVSSRVRGFECTFFVCKVRFCDSTEVATALDKVYSEVLEEFNECYKLFTEMSHCKDIVAWIGIITAFAVYDPEKAIRLFGELCQENLNPDWYTFSTVLKACAGRVTARHALTIHAQVIKGGVLDEMDSRDVVSWNSILKAYSLHGQVDSILLIFQQMDVKPDSATFVALLSACSHAGRVEEGMKIFRSMFEKPESLPQLNHYACVIDMLGRAERFAEAGDLIKQMPMEPDGVIWSAILGSCRKHCNTQLGKLAAEKLKNLEPTNSLSYIQMSNIYSAEGSFNEADKSRKEMETWRVRKEPGLCWTEIGNKVHEFASEGAVKIENPYTEN
ncbi:unnamed protein product [Cochlearia groenlandica]